MKRPVVLMTGAGGGMGWESFQAMLPDLGKKYDLIVLDLDTDKKRAKFERYIGRPGVRVVFGDLLDKALTADCVRNSDICLHIAAFVSPHADYHPKKAMEINFGSTRNLNVGGSERCRVSTGEMYENVYGRLGFTSLDPVIEPKFHATRNFHGQYYLDSDKLEYYLYFRSDYMQYFYDAYLKEMGPARNAGKALTRLPKGQALMGKIIKRIFAPLINSEHGTKHWLDANVTDRIDAFWGSKEAWAQIPEKYSQLERFTDWDSVVPIDHGYDESKPESELSLEDLRGAVRFRGGTLLSEEMTAGDWRTKLRFRCAFGHAFEASPRLVLEGGHWCPECERRSWNYGKRAQVDPFFAQVWKPLHKDDELREYPKEVTELDV